MEFYRKKISFSDLIKRTETLEVTGTTVYFPFFLTQNISDIGIYTDVNEVFEENLRFFSIWNFSAETQTTPNCGVTNDCTVTITETPITINGSSNGALQATITNCVPQNSQSVTWVGPNNFRATGLTINNIVAGSYTLKIIDSNCNITYKNYVLTQPSQLSSSLSTNNSQTNATVGCNGSATVTPNGGTPPYTYTWYQGSTTLPTTTNTINSLCAGQYSVQIKDTTNTIISQYFNISEPTSIFGILVTQTDIDCFGGNTGSIEIKITGGTTVPNGYKTILTGPTPKTITGVTSNVTFNDLSSGSYNIQIIDSAGNTTTMPTITLIQPIQLTTSLSKTDITCYGDDNGVLNVTMNGGTPPYTLTFKKITQTGNEVEDSIPNVSTSSYSLQNLSPGSYFVDVVDSNDCRNRTNTVIIQQRSKLQLSYSGLITYNGYNIPCYGNTVGVTLSTSYFSDSTTTTPSVNTINYYVNGILSGSAPSNLTKTLNFTSGNYELKAVDSAGCLSEIVNLTVTEPPSPLSLTYGIINVNDQATGCAGCGLGPDDCRQGVIDINGGVAPYTISWSDGSNILTSNPHCVGTTLTVSVTDNNGCIIGPISITLT